MRRFWCCLFACLTIFVDIGCNPSNAGQMPVGRATMGSFGALTERNVDNLHAFARLYGFVRYFHPSDQARATDWNEFAIAGVQRVVTAKDAEELAAALNETFLPVAPTVRIYATVTKPPRRSEWLQPHSKNHLALVGYRYHGVPEDGGSANGLYRRELIFPLSGAAEIIKADLGGGVSALVPLTLYRDDGGTLPHDMFPASAAADELKGSKASGNDRTTRLADIVIAWNVFEHFYPNFEFAPVKWLEQLDTSLREAAADEDEYAFRKTLLRLLSALNDGHGYVYLRGRPEYDLPIAWDWVENRLVITAVGPNVTGVVRGDIVRAIDGRDVAEVARNIEPLAPAATQQWKQFAMWSDFLRRDVEQSIRVEVEHADGSTNTVALAAVRYVRGQTKVVAEAPAMEPAKEVEPGIWYVDLSRSDTKAVDALMPRLAAAKGIVFDLRKYPVGDVGQLIRHLSERPLRTDKFYVPVVTRPDRDAVLYDDVSEILAPLQPRLNENIVFLCGNETNSYGEMIISIVDHYQLGTTVGGITAGEDGAVNPFTLPGGYVVRWTGTQVRRPDGSRFVGVGIKPSVLIHRTIQGIRAGDDEVLKEGLRLASTSPPASIQHSAK